MYRDKVWRLHQRNKRINRWLRLKRHFWPSTWINHWTGEVREWYLYWNNKFWCPGKLAETGHNKWEMGYDPYGLEEERYRYTRCKQEREALDNAISAWYSKGEVNGITKHIEDSD